MTDLAPESRFVALLCTPLPSDAVASASLPPPLTPKQWHTLQERIHQSTFREYAEILEADVPTLTRRLNLLEPEAEQIRNRLDGGDQLNKEIERLDSLGIWVLAIADDSYPRRLRSNLIAQAPPILFGCGNQEMLDLGGLAVVGPRNAAQSEIDYADSIGRHCAAEGVQIISGGAKGIDQQAMTGALEAGGSAVGVLGDSLEKQAANSEVKYYIDSRHLTLVSPYHPSTFFDVGRAMGRNKIIYALANWALVVSCQPETGGTWHGAASALKSQPVPVFVRMDGDISAGNRRLLDRGALEFPAPPWADISAVLEELSAEYRAKKRADSDQPGLFNNSD